MYGTVTSHPKISAVVIVAIFIWKLKNWYQRIERGRRMESGIVSINIQLQKIDEQQEKMIKTLLQKIEQWQEEKINTRLQKIEEWQEEVLNLLWKLQSANTSQ